MRGTLRGAAVAWLSLIALHAVASRGGSGRVAEFVTDADRLLQRVLSPEVPAIPDRRAGGAAARAPMPTADQVVGARIPIVGRLPVPPVPN